MSNFTCPTCGLTNIDCGKAGYKTDREIELEKDVERLSDRNAKIEKMLYIAIKALEFCSRTYPMCNIMIVEQALAKIKEVKK